MPGIDLPAYDYPEPELILEFDPPLQAGGLTTNRIVLREPTGGEVRAAEGQLRKGVSPETVRLYQLSLITKVSGENQALIDAMPISKLVQASEYLQAFVSPNLETGKS